jgi:hypothetical protein
MRRPPWPASGGAGSVGGPELRDVVCAETDSGWRPLHPRRRPCGWWLPSLLRHRWSVRTRRSAPRAGRRRRSPGAQPDDALGELARQHATSWMLMIAESFALGTEFADQPHDLPRGLGVEARRGLVDQQQLRVLQQGAGDADPLALAAGKRIGTLVDGMLSGRPAPAGGRPRSASAGIAAQKAAPEADLAEPAGEHVLHHRQAVHQGVLLEDHAHGAPGPAQRRPESRVSSVSLRRMLPPVGSTRRLTQRIRVLLPAPEGPISAITWPAGRVQVDIGQGAVPGGVALGDLGKRQHGQSPGHADGPGERGPPGPWCRSGWSRPRSGGLYQSQS